MPTRVDGRGRVLIPKEIRARLGLESGSPALIEADDHAVHLRPALSRGEALDRLMGGITEENAKRDDEPSTPRREGDLGARSLILSDSSIWIYGIDQRAEEHESTRAWLERADEVGFPIPAELAEGVMDAGLENLRRASTEALIEAWDNPEDEARDEA